SDEQVSVLGCMSLRFSASSLAAHRCQGWLAWLATGAWTTVCAPDAAKPGTSTFAQCAPASALDQKTLASLTSNDPFAGFSQKAVLPTPPTSAMPCKIGCQVRIWSLLVASSGISCSPLATRRYP